MVNRIQIKTADAQLEYVVGENGVESVRGVTRPMSCCEGIAILHTDGAEEFFPIRHVMWVKFWETK